MAYSDTFGQTVNVQTLIDHGARRAGKLAEELTSEQLVSARQSLSFLLQNLINIGIQYFAIDKTVLGVSANNYVYYLPAGANDALNVLYRTMNRPTASYTSSAGGTVGNVGDNDVDTFCLQTSANGNISANFGTNQEIYAGSIGLLPYVSGGGSQTWTLTLEYSTDNVTYTTLESLGTVTVTDNKWIWTDINPGQAVQYYRVRISGGATLALREFYVGNNSTEITMSRLNRDDYTNLPNKNFTSNQPFQFWFDRTIPLPSLYLWPVPSDPFVQITVWYSKQIMDVGSLTNELYIPTRWYEATLMMLSHRMALELPGVDLPRIQYLEAQAEKYLNIVEQEERDRSPIYLAPNISVYTR